MPKKQIAIFVVIDVILVVAAVIAAFRHVKILHVMMAFIVLSVVNGILLIVTALRGTAARR
jgi:hypothetical protein